MYTNAYYKGQELGDLLFKKNHTLNKVNIQGLFSGVTQGLWLDPNDLNFAKIKWRRNLLTYTQDFSNSNWVVADSSIQTGFLAPDGTLTATKFIPNTNSNQYHGKYYTLTNMLTIGKTYTASVYAKAGEYSFLSIGDTANSTYGASFNLSNGTFASSQTTTNSLNVVANMIPVSNGWYRCSVSFTSVGQPPAINSSRVINLRVFSASGEQGYAGDNIKGLYIWGAQVEQGNLSNYQAFTDFNSEFIQAFPYHTLYQDAYGTIPVTSNNQPVALVIDKSRGLSRSNNISLSSVATKTIDGTIATQLLLGTQYIGKWYYIEFTINSMAATNNVVIDGGTGGTSFYLPNNSIGNIKCYILVGSGGSLRVLGLSSSRYDISNIIVEEAAGNHAYQTTSSMRPIFRFTNILSSTENIINGTFNTDASNWTPNGNPTYSVSSGVLNITATGSTGGLYQDITTVIGKTYEMNFVPTGKAYLVVYPNTTFTSPYFSAIVGLKTFVATSTTTRIYVCCDGTNTGTVDNISIKEVTGNYYDKNSIEFDGVDDYLVTNSVDYTTISNMCIFAGVRKLTDSATSIVAELSTSADINAGAFYFAAPVTTAGAGYRVFIKGTTTITAIAAPIASYPAPRTDVITIVSQLATPTLSMRVSGVALTPTTTLVGGNYGNYPIYIGRRGGSTLPFTGRIYGLMIIGTIESDTTITGIENIITKRIT